MHLKAYKQLQYTLYMYVYLWKQQYNHESHEYVYY